MHTYAHVPSMSNLCTKYIQPILYGNGETDLITKKWRKYNKDSRPMSGQAQVTHARLIDTLQCGPPEKKYQARQKAAHILFHFKQPYYHQFYVWWGRVAHLFSFLCWFCLFTYLCPTVFSNVYLSHTCEFSS
jgi:hypothetical protein